MACIYIIFLTLKVFYSDEGETAFNCHQSAAPTWVMHGSHFSTKPLTTYQLNFFSQLNWEMIRWEVENLARTPGRPLLSVISVMGSLMNTVNQHLGLTSFPKDGVSNLALMNHSALYTSFVPTTIAIPEF